VHACGKRFVLWCGFRSRLGDLPHSLGVGHSTLDQKPSNTWMSKHGVA
jgi:hypothetical protein